MKTKTKHLLGAALSLLVTFAFTHNAAAQASGDRIVFVDQTDIQKDTSGQGKPTYTFNWAIFSMGPDGTDVQKLITLTTGSATTGESDVFLPRWSNHQDYILFQEAGTIYIMEAKGEINGGRIFPVVTLPYPYWGRGWDWSPDESQICFADENGLWTVDVNPATEEVGTPTLIREGECGYPAWSPDGSRIAFADGWPSTSAVVTVLDLASGSEFAFDSVPTDEPSWSADGGSIAFEGLTGPYTTRKGNKTSINYYWGIFAANADGTGITQETDVEPDTALEPTWSPDGKKILFVNGGLYTVSLDTGAVSLLRASGWQADWAP